MLTDTANLPREEVQDFLRRLKSYLRTVLTDRTEVMEAISEKAMKTKGKDYEAAMVDEFVLRGLNGFLAEFEGNLSGEKPEAANGLWHVATEEDVQPIRWYREADEQMDEIGRRW